MNGRSNRLHTSCTTQDSRLCVAELIGRQKGCDRLLSHIRAELKRLNTFRRVDADDVFQETIARGLGPDKRDPDRDVLAWLKRIATNYISDELRKDRVRSGPIGGHGPGRELSVLTETSADEAEVIQAASAYLNQRERQLLRLCLQDSSPQVLASALRLSTAKTATGAKWRFFRKIRNLSVALRGE